MRYSEPSTRLPGAQPGLMIAAFPIPVLKLSVSPLCLLSGTSVSTCCHTSPGFSRSEGQDDALSWRAKNEPP